jgi:hypothetical protein
MEEPLELLLDEFENATESAAAAVGEHLRMVASNGPEYETREALRCEAVNIAAWALEFLKETGGIPVGAISPASECIEPDLGDLRSRT